MTEEPFVEDDSRETLFPYGDGKGPVAMGFVILSWIGFFIGMAAYLFLYYFPDLAEWRAW
jgi:hypothetical protein